MAAAAALLFAADPELTADQVTALLEHSADDVNATTGCRRCPLLRDSLSGWGRLDIAQAIGELAGPLPAPDRYETNDDAGARAPRIWGRSRELTATLDYWDDPLDVYSVKLAAGETLAARVQGPAGANLNLELWRPGTLTVSRPGWEPCPIRSSRRMERACCSLAEHRFSRFRPLEGSRAGCWKTPGHSPFPHGER